MAVARIEELRSKVATTHAAQLLLPRPGARSTLYTRLRAALDQAAQRAGCSAPITPHPLRHTFATEMVRLVAECIGNDRWCSGPPPRNRPPVIKAAMIGPRRIHEREYYAARLKAAERYTVPHLAVPTGPTLAGLAGIRQALTATRHMLEMYRRQLTDQKTSRKMRRLDSRLLAVATEVQKLDTTGK